MADNLEYFVGVSWPRSGHNLLARILSAYYGDRFGYCEYYSPKDCCKKIPCYRAGEINLSKNHDYKNIVPMVDGGKYLIQFREFLPSLVSNYELYVRTRTDSEVKFFKFAKKQPKKYCNFMNRWARAEAANATIARISYERLTASPVETIATVVSQFSPSEPLDREKLRRVIQSVKRISVHRGVRLTAPERGVSSDRDIRSFRYYDEALFQALDERTRTAYNGIAELPVVRDISEAKKRGNGVGPPTPVGQAVPLK